MLKPRVSVIIPTYNRPIQLELCLRSIFSQSYSNFEVIVVDGGSGYDIVNIVKQFPLKYLRQEKKGHVNAYNLGVKHALGDILAFIDDDCIADRDWLLKLLEVYEWNHNVSGVGGKILTTHPLSSKVTQSKFMRFLRNILRKLIEMIVMENREQAVARVFKSGFLTTNFDKGFRVIDVDHLQGCNMSFKRKTVETVGGFDEGYEGTGFRFEADFCIRAKKLGFKVYYTPFAIVKHNFDLGKLSHARTLFFMNKNDLYFFFKNLRPRNSCWLRFLLWQSLAFIYLLRGYLSTGNSAFLCGIHGKISGFLKIIRLRLYP